MATLFRPVAQGVATDLTRGAVTTDLARGAVTTDLTRGEATWTDLTAGTAGTAGRTEAWRVVGRTPVLRGRAPVLRRNWGSASGSLTMCSTAPFLAMYLGRPRVCPRRVEWAV